MSHSIIALTHHPESVEFEEWDVVSGIDWAGSAVKPETEIYALLGHTDKNNGISGDGSQVKISHGVFVRALKVSTGQTSIDVIAFLNECLKASEKAPLWVCFW